MRRSALLTDPAGHYRVTAAAGTRVLDVAYCDDWPDLWIMFNPRDLVPHMLQLLWADTPDFDGDPIAAVQIHAHAPGFHQPIPHLGRYLRADLFSVTPPSAADLWLWHAESVPPAWATSQGGSSVIIPGAAGTLISPRPDLLVVSGTVLAGATVDWAVPPYAGPAFLWAYGNTAANGLNIALRSAGYDNPAGLNLQQPIFRSSAGWVPPFAHQLGPYRNLVRIANSTPGDVSYDVAIHARYP